MIETLHIALFTASVSLVTLCSFALLWHHALVVLSCHRERGWLACRDGFGRYASRTFWQSFAMVFIFGTWSWRMWAGAAAVPMLDRPVGWLTFAGLPILALASFDLVCYTLSATPLARGLFKAAAALIILAHLVRFGAL